VSTNASTLVSNNASTLVSTNARNKIKPDYIVGLDVAMEEPRCVY
jgi:hypothetical protein